MAVSQMQISLETLARFLFPGQAARITGASLMQDSQSGRLWVTVEGDAFPDGLIEPVYDDRSAEGLPPRLVSLYPSS